MVKNQFKQFATKLLKDLKDAGGVEIVTPKPKIVYGERREFAIDFTIPTNVVYSDAKKTTWNSEPAEEVLGFMLAFLNVPNNVKNKFKLFDIINKRGVSSTYDDKTNKVSVNLSIEIRYNIDENFFFSVIFYGEANDEIPDPNDKFKKGTILISYSLGATPSDYYMVVSHPSPTKVIIQQIDKKIVSGNNIRGSMIPNPKKLIGKSIEGRITKDNSFVNFTSRIGQKESASVWNGSENFFDID